MANETTYTAAQIATAATELRQAAGAEPEQFSARQAVSMLGDEIRLLRERGFADERIAGLLSGFEIEITPEELARFSEETSGEQS